MRGTSDVGSEARLCLSTDAVLVATGRTPNVEGLNLGRRAWNSPNAAP